MEYLLGGAIFAFIVVLGFELGTWLFNATQKRKALTPLLGVAETTETIEAERRDRENMENA